MVDNVELALEIGCKVGELPSTYLGLFQVALLLKWRLGMRWKGSITCIGKRKGVRVWDASLHLTSPFFLSGVYDIYPKGKLFGRSEVENTGGKKGSGSLVKWEMGMRLGYGKIWERIEISLTIKYPFPWVMGGGWSFGKIDLVEIILFVYPSSHCMPEYWKRHGWGTDQTRQVKRVIGIPVPLSIWTIGNWTT